MEEPVPLISRLIHKFYEPVILLVSLIGSTAGAGAPRPPEPVPIDVHDDKQVFQAFLNKLGHVCDSMKGGNTVTSFVALRHEHNQGGVNYWFAANRRSTDELEATATYVEGLLQKVNQVTEGREHENDVRIDLLCDILRFNRSRVSVYLRTLRSQIEECLTRMDVSDENIENCREILHCLVRLDQSQAGAIIKERAANDRMLGIPSVECWSGLLHTTKRILAYAQSAQFLLFARRRWPELFDKPAVSFVPSSAPTQISIRNKSLTAESIVGRMTRKDKRIRVFRSFVQALQAFDLDDRIESEYRKSSFAPIVHSEILMLNWLETNGGLELCRFFNDWAYIGSSKPTCRLCDYYFQEHMSAVERRPSHGNLYPSWRFPDVLPSQGNSAVVARETMYNRVLQRVRKDAFDMAQKRAPPSCKEYDSNTFSATITLERYWTVAGSTAESDEVADVLGPTSL
ncbi:hypothetical protein TOPH_02769 [Tolypocladium ophioglossoides CBS 100239]|uniref:Uncharacterized protein n=1 Tax=Tolypocladium ophioglossoides (strain CBS 100239) TaxID=1163406 RepID=A0A0L0NF94_TOLOC|nr:hypothetical protein TOPH_02769 [Tolypocladium ophioglossoides CBS 100239]